jgi:hypothetical protein
MARKATLSVIVRLFGEDDFVDQSTGLWVDGGHPRDIDAADPPLKCLKQRHEIPNREDVKFHEPPQRIDPVDLGVKGVIQQSFPKGFEPPFDGDATIEIMKRIACPMSDLFNGHWSCWRNHAQLVTKVYPRYVTSDQSD